VSTEHIDKERLEDVLTPSNGNYNGGGREAFPARNGSGPGGPDSFRFVEVGHTTLDR
jgi:hypothetical protein